MATTTNTTSIEVDPSLLVRWRNFKVDPLKPLLTPAQLDPNDSDYASSGYDTATTSLSSTINEYVFENGTYAVISSTSSHLNADFKGRRYHAYFGTEKNLLPTDEVDRNDLISRCLGADHR
jgi:hypothetical protein